MISEQMVGVVVGGFIAIGGIVVSQVVGHVYMREREVETLTRNKAESLLKALYRHRDWLDLFRSRVLFEDRGHDDPSPLDEALTLQRLYFSSCRGALDKVVVALTPIMAFVYEQGMAKLKNKEAWIADKDKLKPFLDLYRAYLSAFGAAVDEIVRDVESQIEAGKPWWSRVVPRLWLGLRRRLG